MSEEAFLEELRKNEEILFEIIGKRPRLVREPGGKFLGKPDKQAFIFTAGYLLKGWNVDSYDSRKPTPAAEQIINNVIAQGTNERLWKEMIILFHDGRPRPCQHGRSLAYSDRVFPSPRVYV